MIKFSYHNTFVFLIIGFSLLVLIFHVFQIYSHLNYAKNLPTQKSLFYKLLTSKQETESTKILFLGDVMLGRNVEYLSSLHGLGYSTEKILNNLPEADAVVANFESAMAVPHIRTPSFTTTFSTAAWMLPVLSNLKVTHASLANNHSLDYGEVGYKNSVAALQKIDITPFGHLSEMGTSSVVVIDGSFRIGIIAINAIYVRPKESQILQQIEKLSDDTDIQIAYIHWGSEYETTHNAPQETLARSLVAMGIDVIVGHHPHVVQDIDVIDGTLVFYSLGNFIFDQYFSDEVQTGYVLALEVVDKKKMLFSLLPITSIGTLSQPRFMTDDEATTFFQSLSDRSASLLQGDILANNLTWEVNLAYE